MFLKTSPSCCFYLMVSCTPFPLPVVFQFELSGRGAFSGYDVLCPFGCESDRWFGTLVW